MKLKKTNIIRIWCKQKHHDGTESYFQSRYCFKDKQEAEKYITHLNKTNTHPNELSFFCRPEELWRPTSSTAKKMLST